MNKTAPYLTINGNKVKTGTKYFTVHKRTAFIESCTAEEENNVINFCYFLSQQEAEMYSQSILLSLQLRAYIQVTENQHLGK